MDAQRALGLTNARQQTQLIRQLKEIRRESGLSVEDLARETDFDPAFILKFEKGGMNFTASTLRTIARALGAELKLEAKKPGGRFTHSSARVNPLYTGDDGWTNLAARGATSNSFTRTMSAR